MESIEILDVRIDKITLDQAADLIFKWLKDNRKRYVVTPNIEFLVTAQSDQEFKKILNKADLAIPDSARFGWSERIVREKSLVKKLLVWPLFWLSKPLFKGFPVTTGTDLMERLLALAEEKAVTVGFLGGKGKVALNLKECLKERYPKLKVSFAESGGEIDEAGNQTRQSKKSLKACDILFVAFGQVKQEKWIIKNMTQVNAKVFIGVGGAFDYLSGEVKRAPSFMRSLGFEWLFRLTIQPWRIKRFGALFRYLLLIFGSQY